MVQVLKRTPQEPRRSFGEQIGQGLSNAALLTSQHLGQLHEKELQEARMAQEDKKIEALTGFSMSGIKDPKVREKAFELAFKSKLEEPVLERNKSILRDLEERRGLEPGSLSVYEKNPKMAEQISRIERPSKTTQASKPIDPEQLRIIKEIRNTPEYNNASPAKKYQLLTDNGVSKENAKAEADIFAEELKTSGEGLKAKQHEREFFHKESKKFDDALLEQATAAEKKNRALESQLKIAHKLGKWDRVVSALAGQSRWGDLLKSTSAQEFDSYALPQMEGLRQILGGVLSDSDIRLIMQKVVTSSKTPEANEKIAKYLMSENNYILAKKHIGDELKRNNGGYRPSNYDSEIERIFKERYGNQIKQEFEEIKNLPDDPRKINKVGRRVVPPGTPIGENAIKMYFELANGDPVKATELAEEDGYDIPK